MTETQTITNAEPTAWLRTAIQTALSDAERGCDHLGDEVLGNVRTVHRSWSQRALCTACARQQIDAADIPTDCRRCGGFVGQTGGLVRCEYPGQSFTYLLPLCRPCMLLEAGQSS